MGSPFPLPSISAGHGYLHVKTDSLSATKVEQIAYQYPLKLVAPPALVAKDGASVQIVYLLTYGGGIVSNDVINLNINIESTARLSLLTQGSTKIFKSPSESVRSCQVMTVSMGSGSCLCYLPDPVQPYAKSRFEQRQTYNLQLDSNDDIGSICVLDWVTQGRQAREEDWDMSSYISRNKIYLYDTNEHVKRLVLRDNVILDQSLFKQSSYKDAMYSLGVMGTLVLYGKVFNKLQRFLQDEYDLMPRIGGQTWEENEEEMLQPCDSPSDKRKARLELEKHGGLLWTVASIRGCTVIKFGAREVETVKLWLRGLFEQEGSIVNHFGERALLCLR